MVPECSLASSQRPIAAHPHDTRRALDALRPGSRRFGGHHYFRFQLLPSCSPTTTETVKFASNMKIVNFDVFWNITPFSLAERCSCFGGRCCLHLQDTLHLTTWDNTLIRNAAGRYFLPQLFDGYKKTRTLDNVFLCHCCLVLSRNILQGHTVEIVCGNLTGKLQKLSAVFMFARKSL